MAADCTRDARPECSVLSSPLLGAHNKSAFGCTICGASVRATFDELRHAPLGVLAQRIQQSVASVFADDWQKRVAPLEALRRRHGLRAAQSVHLRHPQLGMLVTNMSRLPLAERDFGRGAPVDLKLISEIDSMVAVLPARDGVRLDVFEPFSNVASLPLRPRAQEAIRQRARALR